MISMSSDSSSQSTSSNSSNSTHRSTSSSSRSDSSTSDECSSVSSWGTASTCTLVPAIIDAPHMKTKTLGRSLLVDYSTHKSSVSPIGVDELQLTRAVSAGADSHRSTESDTNSLSLHNLTAPYSQRRGTSMNSSSSRLQALMLHGAHERRKSTGMAFSLHGQRSSLLSQRSSILSLRSARTNATAPPTFSRRRTLERRYLFKSLEKALQESPVPSTDDSSDDKAKTSIIKFHLKKNGPSIAPPSLNRSISNNSTLNELLKESRREKITELLEDPTSLRDMNRSSLRSSFRPVVAIGANQKKRASNTAKQREVAATIAAAAAAKAEKLTASFHEGIRDFSHPAAEAIKKSQGSAVLKKTSPSSHKKKPKLQSASAFRSAPDVTATPKVYTRSSMKDLRASMHSRRSSQTDLITPLNGKKQQVMFQKQQLMRRSASAPRNSFKCSSSSVKSGNRSFAARSSRRTKAELEFAALKALAGNSLGQTLRRRSSTSTAGSNLGVPTSIAVPNRSSSSGSSSTSLLTKASSMNPKEGTRKATTLKAMQETLVGKEVALPMTSPFPVVPPTTAPPARWDPPPQEPTNTTPPIGDSRRARRRSGLLKTGSRRLQSCRHLKVEDLDSSAGDRSDATDEHLGFRRSATTPIAPSSFSSRKSMSLMIQNASLQDSLDLTKRQESRTNARPGAWANNVTTRRRRMMQRAESTTSRSSTARRAASSSSDDDDDKDYKNIRTQANAAGTKTTPIDRRSFMKRQASTTFTGTRIHTLRN